MNLERAKKIAELLGFAADLLHPNSDYGDMGIYNITDKEGRQFTIRIGGAYGKTKGRIGVSGNWPSKDGTKHGATIWPSQVGESSPEITIAEDKTDEQVAKDIQRRFMPEFTRVYDKCLGRAAETMDYEAKELAIKLEIVKAAGKILSDRELEPGGRLYVYGLGSCYLRMFTLVLTANRSVLTSPVCRWRSS
jgi:hypothetical protein